MSRVSAFSFSLARSLSLVSGSFLKKKRLKPEPWQHQLGVTSLRPLFLLRFISSWTSWFSRLLLKAI
uniref:Putative secreted protein n=1 Tax=Anopheles darlingi TaxID=43151 RepID=A0A2M4DCF4_ANODA